MDYDIQRSARHCSVTGRELREGETFYSVLVSAGKEIQRIDFAAEAWTGPPAEPFIGWWKSQVPSRTAKKVQMAPNDVLLEYLHELADRPDERDTRYVLALLLIRRRVLRLEEHTTLPDGREEMALFHPRDEAHYRVAGVAPTAERVAQIERQLGELLFSAKS